MKAIQMLCAAMGLMSVASTVRAQAERSEPLLGLKTFNIVIESLNDSATKCGVTQQDLDTSLRFILGQSNMKIVDTNAQDDGYIYLNVTMLGNCAGRLDLEVSSVARLLKSGKIESVVVWRNGSIRTGGDPKADTTDQVETYAKMLVNDWNSVNK